MVPAVAQAIMAHPARVVSRHSAQAQAWDRAAHVRQQAAHQQAAQLVHHVRAILHHAPLPQAAALHAPLTAVVHPAHPIVAAHPVLPTVAVHPAHHIAVVASQEADTQVASREAVTQAASPEVVVTQVAVMVAAIDNHMQPL